MASPFRVFRKHQKWLLAVLGLMAIFAFVIGDSLMSIAGGGRAPVNPVVVTSVHGTLHEGDLRRMVQMRRILNSFLRQAFEMGLQSQGTPQAYPRVREETEKEAVRVMLLAKKAEQLGFVVSNKTINHYLKQLTGNSIKSDLLRESLRNVAVDGRPVSMDMLFDALREELLASKLEESYVSAAAVTPAALWTPFVKLNDRVTVELVPVPVEKFVDAVKSPSDEQLRKFFDEHKNQFDLPHVVSGVQMKSPEAGFKQPLKAEFQYVKSDFAAIVDLAGEKITDQEIADYYDKNKRQFVRPQLLEDDPDAAKKKPEAEPPADKNGQPNATEDTSPATKPEADDQPAEDKQDGEKGEPGDQPQQGQPPEPEGQLFSVDDPAEPADPNAPAPVGAPAEPAAPAEPKTEQPPAQPAGPGTQPQTSENPPADAPKAEAPPEPEPLPLAEVSDQIRRELARQKAPTIRDDVLRPFNDSMASYSRRVREWNAALSNKAEGAPEPRKPAEPDLKGLAEQHGLTFQETPLLSHYDLQDDPLGQSTVAGQGEKFFNYAFVGSFAIFRPVTTIDDEGNGYVVWKVKEQREFVPEFEQVRDQVLHVWKMVQARSLARDEAERLAGTVRKSGQPLAKALADQPDIEILQSEPFSWLTEGAVPRGGYRPPVRLSTIEGVEGADNNFMQAVFSLDEGQVGVAMNHAQSVAYVVRLTGHETSQQALREEFIHPSSGAWPQIAQGEHQQELTSALTKEVTDEAELNWLREADSLDQARR